MEIDWSAQVLVSWSHQGRLRSGAAFAAWPGWPGPGLVGAGGRSSAERAGDRQLSRALPTFVLVRLRGDPRTKVYVGRWTAEGKSPREIRRCLKRAVAHQRLSAPAPVVSV
jgi:hypothetical protein